MGGASSSESQSTTDLLPHIASLERTIHELKSEQAAVRDVLASTLLTPADASHRGISGLPAAYTPTSSPAHTSLTISDGNLPSGSVHVEAAEAPSSSGKGGKEDRARRMERKKKRRERRERREKKRQREGQTVVNTLDQATEVAPPATGNPTGPASSTTQNGPSAAGLSAGDYAAAPEVTETSELGPDPSKWRIPQTRSLDDCLRYWHDGDVKQNLQYPLKDWPTLAKPVQYRSEAVKWGKIKHVVHEFESVCSADRTAFETRYPGLSQHYTKLVAAIAAARRERKELMPRRRQ